MKYQRERSDFWITIYNNDGSYNISTSEKYIHIIDFFFPIMLKVSPTKWKESNAHQGVWSLWLPDVDTGIIEQFMNWCDNAIYNMLWLGLNRNIEAYFNNELDYCIATDFNFIIGEGRTEIGKAEYQLKYKSENLNAAERKSCVDTIMDKLIQCFDYIPLLQDESLLISSMPSTEQGKSKLAWQLSKAVAEQKKIDFISPILKSEKPQMKQLGVAEKNRVWSEIYNSGGVMIDGAIMRMSIVVIDDLYQSGITMWQYAKWLKSLGARNVIGLVCVKSLKDSDNK